MFVNPYDEVDELLKTEREDAIKKEQDEAAKEKRQEKKKKAEGLKVFKSGVGKYINAAAQ